MNKRGFHQTSVLFSNEIRANPNLVAINSPRESFLQAWWGKFYETYKSRFPDDAVFAAESFDTVAQNMENVVAYNSPANQSYASDHMGANISNVMPVMPPPHSMASSPVMESSGLDLMDTMFSDLLSSLGTDYASLDLSSLQFPEISETGGVLPFASNSGYQMQQMPIVPPEWNGRDDRPDINLGGPTRMEPNIHAPANALPFSPELSDAGNDRSLQQASHQGWPYVGVGSTSPVIGHQVVHPSVIVPNQKELFLRTASFPQQDVLPNVAVQTLDKLKLPSHACSGDFFRMLTQVDLSGKDARMLDDTNQRTLENLQADQQIIAPIGGIMKSSGKQPAVQEQINQLRLQSSDKSGRKRKTPSSYLESIGKEKDTVAGLVSALARSFAAPARTQAEREGISFKEISNLHTKSKLLCCHFDSQGDLLATAGQDGKVLIWELGNGNVNSGEGHAHFVTDIRFRPNSTVFATSSFDRTVKIWDAAKPSNPFRNLVGHAGHVMSIDFHPANVGLLSSCDSYDEIRLWDVNRGDFKLILKGGSRQVRFQPQRGDFLASSTGNIINIFDVETNSIQKKLQGHVKDVRSICWETSGNLLASVSEDSARIWSVSEGKCIHELCSGGNKFQSCTFHSGYAQMLVIGSDEFLELWNPIFQSNITRPYSAHAGIISSLADSPSKRTIASVSHDQWIKIWR
ncbi:hypothetical protein RND71_026229 [Anisodus tanguticus]|uniref:Uncharacterized protein n=1 Tax=Anisodus tanguticus TaxID=243964 RepID=A0AAE1RKJ7_9SOLA|nr:hypothetical protein RND71_026229 [Anisodus tanguticus]